MPDTHNKFLVGTDGRGCIVILNAPLQARRREGAELPEWPAIAPLSSTEALNLAAWLVMMSGRRGEFDPLLEAIAGA